ncbi:MAG TPA: phosphoglycerate dehydrogenase, partial [Bacteroidota bacterium]|nr:phosphoglycerate dehydrogenase [Bacteroidota bacterium]
QPGILIADAVDEKARAVFSAEGFTVAYLPEITREDLLASIGGYAALIVRSRTKVTADVLAAGVSLRAIGRAGAGVDNIDVEEATRRGIVVMNTPGGNTVSTAEHTISMMLALARNIPAADRSVRAMEWKRKDFVGTEVSGKTLGLVGLGKVGQEVARRARALDLRVLACDPLVSEEAARKLGVEPSGLPELYRRADFISLHTPLTPETSNLLNIDTMRACKRGVRIINCARGGILNERDLLLALDEGIVGGAALDVFEQEPPVDHALVNHPRIICTPHLGASTEEAQEKVALQIARQVADFLMERNVTGSVNADLIRIAMRKELGPYLVISEKMGRLMAQLKPGAVSGVRVILSGTIPGDAGEVVLAAFLKGLLASLLTESVNYINATLLARDRGLTIQVTHEPGRGRYPVEIAAECSTPAGSRVVAGTVFGLHDVRITGLDGYHFEARPEGYLLIYYNTDKPGMLARVSAVLANHSVNIAGLSLGRLKPGERALTVIATDQRVSGEIMSEITQIDGVSDIHSVIL